jgi:hypothetical protein
MPHLSQYLPSVQNDLESGLPFSENSGTMTIHYEIYHKRVVRGAGIWLMNQKRIKYINMMDINKDGNPDCRC